MDKSLDQKYDDISRDELEKYLNRPPTPVEIANAQTDTNLVTECLWQIIKQQDARITALEKALK